MKEDPVYSILGPNSRTDAQELEEYTRKLKNIQLEQVRSNQKICADIFSVILKNQELDGFLHRMNQEEFENVLFRRFPKEFTEKYNNMQSKKATIYTHERRDDSNRWAKQNKNKLQKGGPCTCCYIF